MDDRGRPKAVPCSGESTTITVNASGTKMWFCGRFRHREDGPAVEYADGSKEWYRNGLYHREDGPAVEHVTCGFKEWYRNGKLHREDGPAHDCEGGTKMWYRDGKRHREDGPAIECADGSKKWYIHGVRVTKHKYTRKVVLLKLFIAVCASRRNHVPKEKHCWLPAELWGHLAENYFAL